MITRLFLLVTPLLMACDRPAPGAAPIQPSPSPTSTAGPGWPLPPRCLDAEPCKLASGEPGLRCEARERCFNPCPPGMGPERKGSYCAKLCKGSADCAGGTCTPEGICDRWPPPLACESAEICTLEGGIPGARCKESDPCQNPCKKGLVLYGGTHCAKPCKTNADCPGGDCGEGVCGPLCPSEGCPYRWE